MMTPKKKIVEICGLPDRGKTIVGQALATRFGGKFIEFPTIRPDSYTSKILFEETTSKRILEAPRWWAYITAANMDEELSELPDKGLIVLSNYKTGFCGLFKGAFKIPNARDIIRTFPEPDLTFVFTGNPLNLSPYQPLLNKQQTYYHEKFYADGIQGSRHQIVNNTKDPFASYSTTMVLNRILEHCSQSIEKKGYPLLVRNTIQSVKDLTS